MNTGQRLRMLRELKQMSQAEVAKAIGVGRTTYLKYEAGDNKPIRRLKELSALFGVTYDYILGNDQSSSCTKSTAYTEGNLSADETDLIKKYRALDEHGKKRILRNIDGEYLDLQEKLDKSSKETSA